MISAFLFAMLLQGAGKGATLRGTIVTADTGTPVKRAAVQIRRAGAGPEARTVIADAAGAFEIRDIDPGSYSVIAARLGFVNTWYKGDENDSRQMNLRAGQVQTVILRMPRAAVISGTISDTFGEPVVDANVTLLVKVYRLGRAELTPRAFKQTDDRGEYRIYDLPAGRYYVRAGKGREARPGPELATTFYPHSRELQDAQVVIVKAGEEREAINVTLADAPVVSVRGTVVDLDSGQPLSNVFVSLVADDFGVGIIGNAPTRPDGSFQIDNVPPARYRLIGYPPTNAARAPASFSRGVDLRNGTINDLLIKVGPGSTIKGQVKAEGGALPGELQVTLLLRGSDGGILNSLPSPVAADGSFEIRRIEPGSCAVVINPAVGAGAEPLPSNFFLSSASIGDRDITDASFDCGESLTMEMLLKIDLRPAGVTGKALDESGKPVANMNVVLIAADPQKRERSRFFRHAQTDREGNYKLAGIAPGAYLIVLWPGEDYGQLLDPELLAMIEKPATRIALERGATLTQELRLTPEIRTLAAAFAQ